MVKLRNVGVSGWLLVLFLVFGVLTPLAQLASAVALIRAESLLKPRYGENWPTYCTLVLALCGARAFVGIIVGQRLIWDKSPSTPRFAIIGIWVAFGLLHLASLAVFEAFSPSPVALAVLIKKMVWPIIMCVVATLYLTRSKRVLSTYSSTPNGFATNHT